MIKIKEMQYKWAQTKRLLPDEKGMKRPSHKYATSESLN